MTTSSPAHLIRRWWKTVRAKPLVESEAEWVRCNLLPEEWTLWRNLDWRDQRHSYQVALRFVDIMAEQKSPSRAAIAAALLHDVGKTVCALATYERVLATVVGGRTARFRAYLDHEAIGLDLCRRTGSDPETVALLAGDGDQAVIKMLRRADDI